MSRVDVVSVAFSLYQVAITFNNGLTVNAAIA